MECLVKGLKDKFAKGYLEKVIDNDEYDTKYKVKLILKLIEDSIKDHERIDMVFK